VKKNMVQFKALCSAAVFICVVQVLVVVAEGND
jgi:hypothetical protein